MRDMFIIFLLIFSNTASLTAVAELRETTVFARGEEEYFGFRIPAIIATGKGTLLAFAEARRDDLKDDGKIDLVVKRSSDGGATWSGIRLIHQDGPHSIGNPCPVIDRSTSRIWLPFTKNNREVFVTYSDDDGESWASPREITATVKKPNWRWYATGPGVGIQTKEGRLIIPSNHSSPGLRPMSSTAMTAERPGISGALYRGRSQIPPAAMRRRLWSLLMDV